MRFTPQFIKEPLIRIINTFQFRLNGLAWQGLPMGVCGAFSTFSRAQTWRYSSHTETSRFFVSLVLPLMEILVNLPHIVKQITNAYRVRLFTPTGIYRLS